MKNRLLDLFKARWFLLEGGASVQECAAELATMMAVLADHSRAGLTLPLPADYALLRVLRAILSGDDCKRTPAEQKAVEQVRFVWLCIT